MKPLYAPTTQNGHRQKQFVGCCHCLSLFDHFVRLVLKVLLDIFEVELGVSAFLDIDSFLISIVF